MAVVNGKICIFGGSNGQETLADFWKFDLKTSQWENV